MPLWFGSGDLYDDGTHGDLVAGDGIYTNNTITINKWSEFYTRNRLPKKVGLRLIAKNLDSHYTIADTEIMVGNPAGLYIPATLDCCCSIVDAGMDSFDSHGMGLRF